MNDIERIELGGAAGFDDVVVQNLAGTDVKLVAIDFGSAGGTKGDSVIGLPFRFPVAMATRRSPSPCRRDCSSVKGLAAQVERSPHPTRILWGVACETIIENPSAVPSGTTIWMVARATDRLTGNAAYNAIGGGEGFNDP